MAISVFNTADFRSAVAEVCVPALYGDAVRVALRGGIVELAATDGLAGMRSRVRGKVAQETTACLPAAVLRSVVGALPAEEVEFEFGQSVNIVSGSARFELSVLAEELPDWQESAPSLSMDGAALAQGLRAVLYAAARGSRANPSFNGVCFDLDGEALTLVATDGHRLALYGIGELSHQPLRLMIRLADAKKLARVAGQSGSVALSFERGRVVVATDRASLVCAVLNAAFPDYRRIIPNTFRGEVVLSAEAFVAALARVALTANEGNRAIALTADGDGLTLSATSDVGESAERIGVERFSGERLKATYNAKYLREAIEKVAGPVRLRFNPDGKPLAVEPVEVSGYRALVMPLSLAD